MIYLYILLFVIYWQIWNYKQTVHSTFFVRFKLRSSGKCFNIFISDIYLIFILILSLNFLFLYFNSALIVKSLSCISTLSGRGFKKILFMLLQQEILLRNILYCEFNKYLKIKTIILLKKTLKFSIPSNFHNSFSFFSSFD